MSERPTADLADATRHVVEVIERLRSTDGCPWDREQTLDSLKSHLVEECYELLDAIDSGDVCRHLDELGDVLLHVLLQARIREEEGEFSFADVARGLAAKLVRRHPHVFGDVEVEGVDQVLRNWEAIKAGESDGGKRSVLQGVPKHLPALQKAQRVQSRAASVGFDWDNHADVVAKIEEELDEVREAIAGGDEGRIRDELGDLLFAVVNLCRFRGVRAEDALNGTTSKFSERFREVERRVRAEDRTVEECSLAELDAHWEDVKKGE